MIWYLLIEKKINVLPEFFYSHQTHPNPEDSSADSDMTSQRSENHDGWEFQPGGGDSHLGVENDFYHVVRVRLSLDVLTVVLIVNAVLNIVLHSIIVFMIFAKGRHK